MTAFAKASASSKVDEFDIFCSKIGDAYRVYARPMLISEQLSEHFDRHWEAYPVYLDFDDLECLMRQAGIEYTKRVATTGSIQLYGRGTAATIMTSWLTGAFATGTR